MSENEIYLPRCAGVPDRVFVCSDRVFRVRAGRPTAGVFKSYKYIFIFSRARGLI